MKSTDGGVTWSAYTVGDTITLTNVNDYVLLEAGVNGNAKFGKDSNNYYKFVVTGKIEIEADKLNYLLDQSGVVSQNPSNAFAFLFDDCSQLEGSLDMSWLTEAGTNAFRFTFRNTGATSINISNLASISESGLYGTFYDCTNLTSVDLSSLTTVRSYGLRNAFYGCTYLQSVSLPYLTTLTGTEAMRATFGGCTSLKTVVLKKLSTTTGTTTPMTSTFTGCTALEVVDFSEATAIPSIESNTFTSTNNTFQIVVPDSLYSTWIAATNWSALSSQIVKASEYTPAS